MFDNNKIPKIVHFCWFGPADYSLTIKRCISSWKHHLSDYEIRFWNEDSFDIKNHPFVSAAYQAGMFAFVSDYVRMYALNKYGGIYLDTDVEVYKDFIPLLSFDFFIGLEDKGRFGTSAIGCHKEHWLTEKMLNLYDNLTFDSSDAKSFVNVNFVSQFLLEHNFSEENQKEIINNECKLPIGTFGTSKYNTEMPEVVYAKHLFDGSWNRKKKGTLSNFSRYLFKTGLSTDITSLMKIAYYKAQSYKTRKSNES
ncbi:mannosyltransferase [Endozoicomonas sp. OPT23]|uniref:glycosyltransferase family 32 protein n=1 Tax=Endozoicomonas sp. OPT23 TaxID=2072845 RepID=UPI00129BC413|nr:glycosyltransferase [Endozoicomonas sp. OPT23]MRI31604.1 mannosyltransferase [Endozoicomonas sp. OPT23]